MTEPTTDSLLMGGGASFFTFAAKNKLGQFVTKPYGPTNPTKVSGTVASIGDPQQQTDYNSGALKTWQDGKAMLQFAMTLDVDWNNTVDWVNPEAWQRTGPIDGNDTQRSIMVKQSSRLQATLRDAIKEADASTLQLGAYVTVELTGEQPSSKGNPLKIYAVTYQPAAQSVIMADGNAQQAQSAQITQQVAPQPQQQQVQQSVPQMPQQGPPPQPVQQQPQQTATTAGLPDPKALAGRLLAMGQTPEIVAQATGLPVETVQEMAPPF